MADAKAATSPQQLLEAARERVAQEGKDTCCEETMRTYIEALYNVRSFELATVELQVGHCLCCARFHLSRTTAAPNNFRIPARGS